VVFWYFVYLYLLCFCIVSFKCVYYIYALFNFVSYIFLLLCLYILIVMYVLFCIFCFHRTNWQSSATLSEVFPCFSSVLRQMPVCNSQRRGTARTLPKLIVFFCVLFLCKCVLYYCHPVSAQLQLTNISNTDMPNPCTLNNEKYIFKKFISLSICLLQKPILLLCCYYNTYSGSPEVLFVRTPCCR
jgi:hypothetical protein